MKIRCIKCNTITFLPSGRGKCSGCGRFLDIKFKRPSLANVGRKSSLPSSNFSIKVGRAAFDTGRPVCRVSTGKQIMSKSLLSSNPSTEGLLGNIFGLVNRLQDLSEKTGKNIQVEREGKIHILGEKFDLSPAITAFKKEQRRKEARLKVEPKELEVEIHNEPNRVMLIMDLTGFEREETAIEIKPDKYIIITKDRDKKTHRKVISNPPKVDASKSEEHFKGGILSIILPKLNGDPKKL